MRSILPQVNNDLISILMTAHTSNKETDIGQYVGTPTCVGNASIPRGVRRVALQEENHNVNSGKDDACISNEEEKKHSQAFGFSYNPFQEQDYRQFWYSKTHDAPWCSSIIPFGSQENLLIGKIVGVSSGAPFRVVTF